MIEAIKMLSFKNTHLLQRISIKLYVGVVGECYEVRLVKFPLVLLTRQFTEMRFSKGCKSFPDDNSYVLQAHSIDGLMNRRDEFD